MCLTFAVRLWFLICNRQWQVLFICFLKSVLKHILFILVGSFSNSCPNLFWNVILLHIFKNSEDLFCCKYVLNYCLCLEVCTTNMASCVLRWDDMQICSALPLHVFLMELTSFHNTHETVTCLLCSVQNAEVSWEIMLFVPPCLSE